MSSTQEIPATVHAPSLRRPELLAPAGDRDCLRAAVENGADAVYFGLDSGFNARARAANFRLEELPEVMDFPPPSRPQGLRRAQHGRFLRRAGAAGRDRAAGGRGGGRCRDGAGPRIGPADPPGLPRAADARLDPNDLDQRRVPCRGASRWGSSAWCCPASCRSARSPRSTPRPASAWRPSSTGPSAWPTPGSVSPANRSADARPIAASVPRPAACRTSWSATAGRGPGRDEVPAQPAGPGSLRPAARAFGRRRLALEDRGAAEDGRLRGQHHPPLPHGDRDGAGRPAGRVRAAAGRGDGSLFLPRLFPRLAGGLRPQGPGARPLLEQAGRAGGRGAGRGPRPGRGRAVPPARAAATAWSSTATAAKTPRRADASTKSSSRAARWPRPSQRGLVELTFAHGAIDFHQLYPGQKVWKTDDPQLTRRLRQTYAGPDPQCRVPLELTVEAGVGSPLRITGRAASGATCRIVSDSPLEEARKHPLTEPLLRQQLGRLGGTSTSLPRWRPSSRAGRWSP